jgi:hypothetical protein
MTREPTTIHCEDVKEFILSEDFGEGSDRIFVRHHHDTSITFLSGE